MLELFSEVTKIKPLIKWTGGKFDEYPIFKKFIPEFDNYYEPFFGGGGVFFQLQPKNKSYINDKSKDLIDFYRLIGNKDFETEMYLYAQAWEASTKLSNDIRDRLNTVFQEYIDNIIDDKTIDNFIKEIFRDINSNDYFPLFDTEFSGNSEKIKTSFVLSLNDKFRRIKNICLKENKNFTGEELLEHIETGIKSGLYFYIRSILNDYSTGKIALPISKHISNWYFIREFCYASMFRYNSKGEFNIPYGGIAYNSKRYRSKIENIFENSITNLLSNTKIFNLDFEEFLKKTKPSNSDFVFLDPPYDTEFSDYDNNSFSKDDQIRLRNTLSHVSVKWMLVIKETPFIKNLYTEIGSNIIDFDKTYTYNVRGRNNRDTQHLIITNYDTI